MGRAVLAPLVAPWVCQRNQQMIYLAREAECVQLYEGRPLVSTEIWRDVPLASSMTAALRQPVMTAARESGAMVSSTRVASAASAATSITCGSLYLCDALREGLAQHLQDVAAALRQFIQQEHPMMRQRRSSRHRHLTPTDQPHIGARVMGGATRARSDERGAVTGEAGDAGDAGGVDGFSQRHVGENSSQQTAEEVSRRAPADPFSLLVAFP
jgi:hypothetical protein